MKTLKKSLSLVGLAGLGVLVLWGYAIVGCAGERTPEADAAAEAVADSEATAPSQRPAQGESASYDRESFALCPVIEEHKSELASIIGFAADPDRAVETLRSECNVRGESGSFVKVELVPAFMPSIEMYASGYEDPVSAAPELGEGAMYVDSPMQPHVIFPMGDLIIDVGAEALETPDRATMIELAERVRVLLTEANS